MIDYAIYNQITEKMTKLCDEYERLQFENNKYSLSLANGDYLNIRIPRSHIMHLLGLNADYLKLSNRFRNNMSSYDFLKYFLDNAYSFHRLVSNKEMNYDNMFSNYVNEKLDSFWFNINIRTDDMYFIIKYDKSRTYTLEDKAEISDYYIVRKSLNNYYVMGVVQSENNPNMYYPATSRVYSDHNEFENFMKRISNKQEITYCYSMRVTNLEKGYEHPFFLTNEDRRKSLSKAVNVAKKYNGVASVSKDFQFALDKSITESTNNATAMNILDLLSENLKTGNVLDMNVLNSIYGDIELPNSILQLISVSNDVVCSMDKDNDQALINYSDMNNENISLKNELKSLKEEVLEYKRQIEELTLSNTNLTDKNSAYEEKMNILEEAYQKIKSI